MSETVSGICADLEDTGKEQSRKRAERLSFIMHKSQKLIVKIVYYATEYM